MPKKEYQIEFSKLAEDIALYRSAGLLGGSAMLFIEDILQQPYLDFTGHAWTKGIKEMSIGPPEYYDIVTNLVQQLVQLQYY